MKTKNLLTFKSFILFSALITFSAFTSELILEKKIENTVQTLNPVELSQSRKLNANNMIEPLNPKQLVILSICGGGIRGLIPSIVITALELIMNSTQLLNKKDHNYIGEFIDCVAGVSAGSIVGSLIAVNDSKQNFIFKGSDMCELFEENKENIFAKNSCACKGLCKPIYDNKKFINIIEDILNEKVHGTAPKHSKKKYQRKKQDNYSHETNNTVLLSDIKKVNAVYYAFDTAYNQCIIFKNWKAISDQTRDFELKDAVVSSCAVPYGFPSYTIQNRVEARKYNMIDGGICGCDPSLIAFASMAKHFPDHRIILINLGTGYGSRSIPEETDPKLLKRGKKGALSWGISLIGSLKDSSDSVTKYLFSEDCLKDSKINYHSINPTMTVSMGMDSIEDAKIYQLKCDTYDYISQNFDNLKKLAYLLIQNRFNLSNFSEELDKAKVLLNLKATLQI